MQSTDLKTAQQSESRTDRYLAPDRLTRSVVNPLIMRLTRLGLSVRGSRVLEVPGRVSGRVQHVPVNVLTVDGERYLVAPRGVTQWVRNVRAAGGCTLVVGRRREQVTVVEIADDDKPDLLAAYLSLWSAETSTFFGGVGADAGHDELRRIAGDHPVFRLHRVDGADTAGTAPR